MMTREETMFYIGIMLISMNLLVILVTLIKRPGPRWLDITVIASTGFAAIAVAQAMIP